MTELERRAARMKWDPPPPGSEARKEMPASAFLSPSTRTFPYKVKIDDQWVISEPGLRSAISVANFRGNSTISAKASALLEKLHEGKAEHSDVEAVLAHFGVRGMKWGRRKSQDQLDQAVAKKQAKQEVKERAKDVAARMKRDKRRMQFEDRDLGARTSDGQAVVERIFKDLKGKEYSMQDIQRYQNSRAGKQAILWTGVMLAAGLGGTALSALSSR